jgi:hypothetical protein
MGVESCYLPGPVKQLCLDLVVVVDVDDGPVAKDISQAVNDAVHGVNLSLAPVAVFRSHQPKPFHTEARDNVAYFTGPYEK